MISPPQGRTLPLTERTSFFAAAVCLIVAAGRHGMPSVLLLIGGAGWAVWVCRQLGRHKDALSAGVVRESGLNEPLSSEVPALQHQGAAAEFGAREIEERQAESAMRDREQDELRAQIDALSERLTAQCELTRERDAQLADALAQVAHAQEQESGWQALALAAQDAQSQAEQERQSLSGRIGGMADALAGQVVTCLAEAEQAISTAIEAFTRIADEAQEAAGLAQRAVGVETEQSVSGIATRATQVMGLFIEGMLSGARRIAQSAKQLERLTDVSQRLCGLAGDVENVADATTMVALNASIEAARAGHAGRTFTVVAKEVGKLAQTSRSMAERMRGLTQELRGETQVIHTDLAQMARSSQDESGAAQAEVNHLLELLREADTSTQGILKQLAARSQNITANYGGIVMAFQFHDLLRQRLEHVAQPLTELGAQLAGRADAQEKVLAYAVGQNAFQARAVGAAPTLEVVTYAPAEDDNVTLF